MKQLHWNATVAKSQAMDRAVFSSILSIPILLENSWEKVAGSYIKFTYRTGHAPYLGYQHTTLLEAPKPAQLIPHYKTQVNTIKQLL